VPIRAGTDIAFLGAIVNHIIENRRWFHDYVVPYTNASAIVSDDFRDTEDLDGLFSGWDDDSRRYNSASWALTGSGPPLPSSPTATAVITTAATAARYRYSSVVLVDAFVSVLTRRAGAFGRCLLLKDAPDGYGSDESHVGKTPTCLRHPQIAHSDV